MGKKSRRNKGAKAVPAEAAGPSESSDVPPQSAPRAAAGGPEPSDSGVLRTDSATLQAKLDHLAELGAANDRAGFVEAFVPLDLSPAEKRGYLEDLTTASEGEGQWTSLVVEIAAIQSGRGVQRIEGDQVSRAVFQFVHPLYEKCDREVGFLCVGGDWRAEG